MSTTLVILICGIPGSGKSTLGRLLSRQLVENRFAQSVEILSFDEVGNDIEWNSESFHLIRHKALDRLITMLSSTNPPLISHDINLQCPCQRIIIVDDIMYLRSMRRQVYVIARDAHAKLLTIFVNTNPSLAKQRNLTRNEKECIAGEAMERIISHFEGPSDMIYDRNHIRLPLDDFDMTQDALDQIMTRITKTLETSGFDNAIHGLHEPVGIIDPSAKSKVKIVDDMLRKLISQLIPRLQKITENKLIGKYCSNIKADTLKFAKLYHIEDFGSETAFCEYIRRLFIEKLQEVVVASINDSSALCIIEGLFTDI